LGHCFQRKKNEESKKKEKERQQRKTRPVKETTKIKELGVNLRGNRKKGNAAVAESNKGTGKNVFFQNNEDKMKNAKTGKKTQSPTRRSERNKTKK
jgi:hypothetical protein